MRYNKYVAYSKSDTANFTDGPSDAIYVGTKGSTGTVVVVSESGAAISFVGVAAGTILPVQAIRINSTTTDASDFVILYTV